ncbi:hypothetical protein ACOMHN_043392 [Nucella lapillus]
MGCRVCVLFLLLALQAECGNSAVVESRSTHLRIGAFNIQIFGRKKMSNANVAEQIKKIVELYDVLFLQEIRDNSMESVRQLRDMLPCDYQCIISKPLGRSNQAEQYAYFYRNSTVRPLGAFVYDDPRDVFEREPFVFKFTSTTSDNDNAVSLIGLHSKPRGAIQEIGHLGDVIARTLERMGYDSEPVVLGDLNADCNYANLEARQNADDPLTMNNHTYVWLIEDGADTTTTTNTQCAYDRIIIRRSLLPRLVGCSAKVFHFDKWLGLTNREARKVSDHYPVEMKLRF